MKADPGVWAVPAEEAWYVAVREAIDDAMEDAMTVVCSMEVAGTHGYVAHAAGGLEALRVLAGELERRRVEAFEVKSEA